MKKSPDNPGTTARGRFARTDGVRAQTESFDVVEVLRAVLGRHGHEVVREGDELRLTVAPLSLLPLLVDEIEPLEDGGVHTVTTIEVLHPLFPDGLFEYQHAAGSEVAAALATGFEQFVQLDLAPLLDALVERPTRCNSMETTFPARDGHPARRRRVVLGPVWGVAERRDQGAGCDVGGDGETHAPYCPCCFLTNNFEAFDDLLVSDAAAAIRFYAMRDGDGGAGADCRVNGRDHEPGKAALCAYVARWPDAGVEMRKQYAVVHSLPVE